jgi:hypothetical protein
MVCGKCKCPLAGKASLVNAKCPDNPPRWKQ